MEELKRIEKPVQYVLPEGLDENTVLILPERINDDGISLYTHSSMELFKDLREKDDVKVEYFDGPGGRKWIDRLGTSDEIVVPLVIGVVSGVISAAIWYAIQRFAIERRNNKNMRIKITLANRNSDPAWVWYEFEGSPEEVSNLAEKVIDGTNKEKPKGS